jgi:hypothetical protein
MRYDNKQAIDLSGWRGAVALLLPFWGTATGLGLLMLLGTMGVRGNSGGQFLLTLLFLLGFPVALAGAAPIYTSRRLSKNARAILSAIYVLVATATTWFLLAWLLIIIMGGLRT